MRRRRVLGLASLAALVAAPLAACSSTSAPRAQGTSTPSPPPASASASASPTHGTTRAAGPCGWPHPPPVRHVIWIWMENRAYGDVLGSSHAAPHLSSYARACGLATNYQAITHPSLPNYLAATSGSTGGVSSDCAPSECPQYRTSLFAQLDAASLQWRTYAEAMPSPCTRVAQGKYATKHNPAVYFPGIRSRCAQWDLPMGGADGPFARDLAARTLAAFTFIEPDICDDGHDCSTTFADEWLGAMLDRITRSPAYRAGGVAVFVTWDEGDGSDQHIATVVLSPGVRRGTRDATPYTHYSLLRTTEALFGLPPLGNAATANDMRAAFGLSP